MGERLSFGSPALRNGVSSLRHSQERTRLLAQGPGRSYLWQELQL